MSSTSLAGILGDGKAFTEVFVQPMVDAVRTEMQAHVAQVTAALQRVNTFDGRISTLESNQKKALIGWGVLASAAVGVVMVGWGRIKQWIGLS